MLTIGVIGKNEQNASDPVDGTTMHAAYEIGRLVAAGGGVIVSGGLGRRDVRRIERREGSRRPDHRISPVDGPIECE